MRAFLILAAACAAFFVGIMARDAVKHAEASSVSGGSSSIATIGAGTSAQLASAITDETGTAGALVFSAAPTLTGAVAVSGSVAVTGSVSATLGVSAATGAFTGAVTMGGASTCDRMTCTSTSGVSVTATGQGTSVGGSFTGGGTLLGQNYGTVGVLGTGGSGGGAGVRGVGAGIYSGVYAECGTGRAITMVGDATSPTYGHFNLNAMDANPSLTPGTVDYAAVSDGTNTYLRQNFYTTIGAWHDVGSALSVSTANTAFATGGQASATVICDNNSLTVVTTVASAGDSVKFPAAGTAATSPPRGKICRIKNKGANAMDLFPASGGTLCVHPNACLSADTATSVAVDDEIECWHQGSDVWNCR